MSSHRTVGRRGLERALLATVVAAMAAGGGHAAVLPLADDPFAAAGPRAGLLTAPMAALAGRWVGHTASGRVVSLVLTATAGAQPADATLEGLAADTAAGPRRLVAPMVRGRTLAFSVQASPCTRALTQGVVTFVSAASAQLQLHGGPAPVSIRLSKVG